MADFYRERFDFLLGRFDSLGGRFDFRVGRFDQPPRKLIRNFITKKSVGNWKECCNRKESFESLMYIFLTRTEPGKDWDEPTTVTMEKCSPYPPTGSRSCRRTSSNRWKITCRRHNGCGRSGDGWMASTSS